MSHQASWSFKKIIGAWTITYDLRDKYHPRVSRSIDRRQMMDLAPTNVWVMELKFKEDQSNNRETELMDSH